MSEVERSLDELRRLGLYLDPGEARAAAARRATQMNTRAYPLLRAAGFHLLMFGMAVHNAAVFGAVGWLALLGYALVVEAYLVGSWLALRRWYERAPRLGGWDLADVFFVADLVLWGAAIQLTGGPGSLLWILPLLRVADHHPVPRVWVFAHLAPLTYAGVLAWAVMVAGQTPVWSVELTKLFVLYAGGLYIGLISRPSQRYKRQRQAALSTASALLADLAARTQRLDEANRSRGSLKGRIGSDVLASLVRIGGFADFLLRTDVPLSRAQRDYVEGIRRHARSALRVLEEVMEESRPPPSRPRISLTGTLQTAATEEAREAEEWREAAQLQLPAADVQVHADQRALAEIFRHLLSAARELGGGAPLAVVRADPATGMGEAVDIRCGGFGPANHPVLDLRAPLAGAPAGDQAALAARLGLDLAVSLCRAQGYHLESGVTDGRLTLTLRLR